MANLYSAPSISTMKVGTFKGVDHSAPEDQQKPYRAADSENMMPGATGEVCKRPGVQVDTENYIASAAAAYGGTVVKKCENSFVVNKDGLYALFVLREVHIPAVSQKYYCEQIREGLQQIPVIQKVGNDIVAFYNTESESCVCIANDTLYIEYAFTNDGKWKYTGVDSSGSGTVVLMAELWANSTDSRFPVPHYMQGCKPEGGGDPFEAANMLNPYVMESFRCTSEYGTSVFRLNAQVIEQRDTDRFSGTDIADKFHVEVLCKVQETDGDTTVEHLRWVTRPIGERDGYRCSENWIHLNPVHNTKETCYYMLDGEKVFVDVGTGTDGTIGATPVEGKDNVRITHLRADAGETFRKICGMRYATIYGVGGHKDRLVLAGGSTVYYSEIANPFYIADINYITVDEMAQIYAVSGIADSLSILTDRGIYMAKANAIDTAENVGYARDTVLLVSRCIAAPAPISNSVSVLGGELVYLSTEGVVAIASKENYDERYAEHRSALIDRKMMQDGPVELISLGRFLMIRCANGVWWLLDENQPNSEGDKPYASHQYEGWRLTGMPCDVAWEENGVLKLILADAQYYWTAGTAAQHFHDEYEGISTPIVCWWEVPWIYGGTFYRKKIFMKLGILLGELPGADTCVKIEGKKNDEDWAILWPYDGALCSFGYNKFDYRLFTYSGAAGDPNRSKKIKIKKATRFKLRFINEFIDQPMILREYGLDYVQEN